MPALSRFDSCGGLSPHALPRVDTLHGGTARDSPARPSWSSDVIRGNSSIRRKSSIAEMGAWHFPAMEAGIVRDQHEQSAAYLQSWLEALRANRSTGGGLCSPPIKFRTRCRFHSRQERRGRSIAGARTGRNGRSNPLCQSPLELWMSIAPLAVNRGIRITCGMMPFGKPGFRKQKSSEWEKLPHDERLAPKWRQEFEAGALRVRADGHQRHPLPCVPKGRDARCCKSAAQIRNRSYLQQADEDGLAATYEDHGL